MSEWSECKRLRVSTHTLTHSQAYRFPPLVCFAASGSADRIPNVHSLSHCVCAFVQNSRLCRPLVFCGAKLRDACVCVCMCVCMCVCVPSCCLTHSPSPRFLAISLAVPMQVHRQYLRDTPRAKYGACVRACVRACVVLCCVLSCVFSVLCTLFMLRSLIYRLACSVPRCN